MDSSTVADSVQPADKEEVVIVTQHEQEVAPVAPPAKDRRKSLLKTPQKYTPRKRQKKTRTPVDREIKKLQTSTERLIPRAPFSRLVHGIARAVCGVELRLTKDCVDALHDASEELIVAVLSDAHSCAEHAGRDTVGDKDIRLACRIRGIPIPVRKCGRESEPDEPESEYDLESPEYETESVVEPDTDVPSV